MRTSFAALGAGLSLSLVTTSAHAGDESLEALLSQEVVTSVSKSAESSQDAPALTRSISGEEIHRYGLTSIDEALDYLGVGVHVVRSLDHSELTVRGVAFPNDRGNHILVLVDGHVVNEPLFGDAPIDQRLGIPLELVDHVELVLGPGSAIYGTNAVLAVVNIVTKSAKENAGFHVAAEGGAIGTLRSTATMGRSFDLLGKRASFTAGLSYFGQRSSIELPFEDLGAEPGTGQRLTWGGTATDAYKSNIGGLYFRFVRDGLEIAGRGSLARTGEPSGLSDFDDPRSGHDVRRGSVRASQTIPLDRRVDLTATAYADAFENDRHTFVSRRGQCPFAAATCDYREDEGSHRLGSELRLNVD
jgi:outer membrane receptor protein involved in Fe transport